MYKKRKTLEASIKKINKRIIRARKQANYTREDQNTDFGTVSSWDENLLNILQIQLDTPEKIVTKTSKNILILTRSIFDFPGETPFLRRIFIALETEKEGEE